MRRKNQRTRGKTFWSRVENQRTQPTYGSQWKKVSALISAPTLLPACILPPVFHQLSVRTCLVFNLGSKLYLTQFITLPKIKATTNWSNWQYGHWTEKHLCFSAEKHKHFCYCKNCFFYKTVFLKIFGSQKQVAAYLWLCLINGCLWVSIHSYTRAMHFCKNERSFHW